METASAMAPRRAHHHHHRRYKPRWEYKGVFSATASTPTKTTPTRVGHAAPLVESFLSDESMATSRSITTVASSIEAQTPSHQQQPTPPSAASSSATRARPQGRACVDDDSLATMGRVAKKRIETLARRDALVGRWRRRRLATAETTSSLASHRGECQVLEFQSPRHDEFKIVARMNIAGSLREIMGVLATDNAAHFHQSMAALFGAPYVTGEKLRASESLGLRRSSTQSARALLLSSHRLSTRPTTSSRLSSFFSSSSSSSVSNIKIALNSVTLQLRHGFFRRRLHDLQFLDYLDEKVDAMAVTRVLQTVRAPGHSGRPSLGELFAGYVIREDPQAQFTRVFFYGDARGNSVASYTKRLLRTMVETLVRLVATVERQRLSALYMLHRRSESVPVAAGRCFACDAGFTTAKRRHTCACCRQSVCRACLEVRAIERTGDSDGSAATKALEITHGPPCLTRVRVCRCCVDRVSLPSMADGKGQKERPLLDQGEEEDDDDEIVVVDSSSEDDSDA